jgi:hypothetical protein
MRRGMDDRENLSQPATVITSPEINRLAPIYRKEVALPGGIAATHARTGRRAGRGSACVKAREVRLERKRQAQKQAESKPFSAESVHGFSDKWGGNELRMPLRNNSASI